jgi:hypothetical protein
LPHKKSFEVIDLGNNAARFGFWDEPINWQMIFKFPDMYLESIRTDDDIERNFRYELPPETRKKFSRSKDLNFDTEAVYKEVLRKNLKTKTVLDLSVMQHAKVCVENTETPLEARILAKTLYDEVAYRIKVYTYCLGNCTKNYGEWLEEDYKA